MSVTKFTNTFCPTGRLTIFDHPLLIFLYAYSFISTWRASLSDPTLPTHMPQKKKKKKGKLEQKIT